MSKEDNMTNNNTLHVVRTVWDNMGAEVCSQTAICSPSEIALSLGEDARSARSRCTIEFGMGVQAIMKIGSRVVAYTICSIGPWDNL